MGSPACLLACHNAAFTHTNIHSIGLMLVPSIPLRYRCCFVSSPLQNMFVFTQTTIFIRLTEHLCRSKSKIDIMLSTLHMIVFTLSSHTRNQTTDDRKKFKREHTPHCTTDNIAQSSNSLPISVTLYSVFAKARLCSLCSQLSILSPYFGTAEDRTISSVAFFRFVAALLPQKNCIKPLYLST